MTDVTTRLNSFRECVRHLWNSHFLPSVVASSDKWALRDEFDAICSALFGCLVVDPLRLAPARDAAGILSTARDAAPRTLPWLHLVPNAPAGVPIMINRDPTA